MKRVTPGLERLLADPEKYLRGSTLGLVGTKPGSDEKVVHGPSVDDPLAARVFKTIS